MTVPNVKRCGQIKIDATRQIMRIVKLELTSKPIYEPVSKEIAEKDRWEHPHIIVVAKC